MNPKHQVIWAKVAENDLKEIVEFISVESPGNALKLLKKIKAKAACL